MKTDRQRDKKWDITRREFIQYSAAAGAALTLPALFAGCSDSGSSTSHEEEYRTFYFDLSHGHPAHNFYLKAGSLYLNLVKMDPETLQTARQSNPLLARVPDERITHYAWDIPLPASNISLCWIVGQDPSAHDGSWNMPLMFYHLPRSALRSAAQRPGAHPDFPAAKFQMYGLAPGDLDPVPDAYLLADDIKNWHDQAVGMVFGHQELICAQKDSAGHVQTNIISPQPRTQFLTGALSAQGTATENGGWAKQEVYINPDTGQPYLNSQGQKQYFPRWSDMSLEATGGAIEPCVQQAKNDTTLGVNITDLDPAQENAAMSGKIWKVRDGITSVDASAQPESGDSDPTMTWANRSCEQGYTVENVSSSGTQVTFKVHNWYARFLGVYVRFLDAGGNPIAVADLPASTTDCFPSWGLVFKEKYDNFAFILDAEFEILGIPIKDTREDFKFTWPQAASSALILASGLGTGEDDQYVPSSNPGGVLTGALNLAVPTIFLPFGAGLSYMQWLKRFTNEPVEAVKLVASVLPELLGDGFLAGVYDKPRVLIEVAKTLGEFILSSGAKWLISSIIEALGGAEAEDSIPVIGAVLNALSAAGMVAEIAQTSAEIARSPTTYVTEVVFTHNISVTILYDSKNDFEFPAVATYYVLKAYFDSGTLWESEHIKMSGTSRSDPLSYSFNNVPYGGKVNIKVGFYSANDWLAGQGSTGSIQNDAGAADVTITITENKVPLQINTVYSHKEKTFLDKNGELIWEASEAPTATRSDLNCGNQDGDLCQMAGITVSEHFAAAGYAWKSYSSGVASCAGGGEAQLFQFAGMSIAQDPQSGHATSGCGFSNPVRIVYDLMGSGDNNYYLDTTGSKKLVRQIRLARNQKPDFDGPDSNLCWGAFTLPSDAFLIHPQRRLISLNSENNKIEILKVPREASPDAQAKPARVRSAKGSREGLLDGPICAAIAPNGAILVLESNNNRIQAFDLGGNPARHFGSKKDQFFTPLRVETDPVTYLDMAAEYVGYLYVLSYITQQGIYQYRLDIYTPEGDWLCRTTDVNADKLAVDFWRNAYTLNYETLTYPDGTLPTVTEPSVSQWIPSTP